MFVSDVHKYMCYILFNSTLVMHVGKDASLISSHSDV